MTNNPISQAARDAAAQFVTFAGEVRATEGQLIQAFNAVYRAGQERGRELERKAVEKWLRTTNPSPLGYSIIDRENCVQIADAISRAGHLPKEPR